MAVSNLKIIQLRYYGFHNEKNIPSDNDETGENLWIAASENKNLFTEIEDFGGAIKIGIQTLPGVEFRLNGLSNDNKIIVDHTGVFELDLSKTNAKITSLYFTPESIIRIDEVDNANIIIDILYNSQGEAVN